MSSSSSTVYKEIKRFKKQKGHLRRFLKDTRKAYMALQHDETNKHLFERSGIPVNLACDVDSKCECLLKCEVTLVVLGQSNFAKSVIVNELLRKPVLPVETKRTSKIWRSVRIRGGNKNLASLSSLDSSFELGDISSISSSDIINDDLLLQEPSDSEDMAKKHAFVDMTLNSEALLHEGLCILVTPTYKRQSINEVSETYKNATKHTIPILLYACESEKLSPWDLIELTELRSLAEDQFFFFVLVPTIDRYFTDFLPRILASASWATPTHQPPIPPRAPCYVPPQLRCIHGQAPVSFNTWSKTKLRGPTSVHQSPTRSSKPSPVSSASSSTSSSKSKRTKEWSELCPPVLNVAKKPEEEKDSANSGLEVSASSVDPSLESILIQLGFIRKKRRELESLLLMDEKLTLLDLRSWHNMHLYDPSFAGGLGDSKKKSANSLLCMNSELVLEFEHEFQRQLAQFVRRRLQNYMIHALSSLYTAITSSLQDFILQAYDIAHDLITTPKRLGFAKSQELTLYQALLNQANLRQSEIQEMIAATLETMRSVLPDMAAEEVDLSSICGGTRGLGASGLHSYGRSSSSSIDANPNMTNSMAALGNDSFFLRTDSSSSTASSFGGSGRPSAPNRSTTSMPGKNLEPAGGGTDETSETKSLTPSIEQTAFQPSVPNQVRPAEEQLTGPNAASKRRVGFTETVKEPARVSHGASSQLSQSNSSKMHRFRLSIVWGSSERHSLRCSSTTLDSHNRLPTPQDCKMATLAVQHFVLRKLNDVISSRVLNCMKVLQLSCIGTLERTVAGLESMSSRDLRRSMMSLDSSMDGDHESIATLATPAATVSTPKQSTASMTDARRLASNQATPQVRTASEDSLAGIYLSNVLDTGRKPQRPDSADRHEAKEQRESSRDDNQSRRTLEENPPAKVAQSSGPSSGPNSHCLGSSLPGLSSTSLSMTTTQPQMSNAIEALKSLLNFTYGLSIPCKKTTSSVMKGLFDNLKGILVRNIPWQANTPHEFDDVWKRKVAREILDSLSDARIAREVCAQIVERLKVSHENFIYTIRRLEARTESRSSKFEEAQESIRRQHAPRLARQALEVSSLRNFIAFGIPTLGREIGRGQYGVVYACSTWGPFTNLAVKSVIPPDDKHWKDLALEIYYCKHIPEHERIVTMYASVIDYSYGCGTSPAVLLIMERLVRDLYTAIKKNLEWPKRLRVAMDVAEGMRYLHSQGLVHRDIKPRNVLLDAQDRGKLTDLGFCKPQSMMSGSILGTPMHMAPEIFQKHYDFAIDVYAFGVLFWYICAGRMHIPSNFEQCGDKDMLWHAVRKGVRPERLPGFADEAWELMRRCWAQEPAARPHPGQIFNALARMYEAEVKKSHSHRQLLSRMH